MRKFLILVPFLFFGVKPYNQNIGIEVDNSSSDITEEFSVKVDTMLLSYTAEKLIQEDKELNELKNYKRKLEAEYRKKKEKERLNRLKARKRKEEAKLLKEIENDINNFLNRGI